MKASRNYWVDLVMGVLAMVLVASSFTLWVVLPQGYFRSRLVWLDIHKWTGLAVTAAVAIHLLLHWRWLWSMTKRRLHRVKVALGPDARVQATEPPRAV